MNKKSLGALVISTLVMSACNPFRGNPAVQVSAEDSNLNSRWHATLASPASLAGAVQMSGLATMTPGSGRLQTTLTLSLANAAPGGVHPWQVHYGQCGADEGVFGYSASYQPIKVGDDGRATSRATVSMQTPTSGSYFVTVHASAANREMIVACGNLAPPAM